MCKNLRFDHNCYLAGLQFKRAEYRALRDLAPEVKQRIVPFFTPSPHDYAPEKISPNQVDDEFKSFVRQLESVWEQRRFFIDLGVLHPELRGLRGKHPVEVMWREAAAVSLFPPTPVPVVALTYNSTYKSEVKSVIRGTDVGVCLRLNSTELFSNDLTQKIEGFLQYFSLTPESVDLVVDFGVVDITGMSFDRIYEVVPHIDRWRTYACLGGSFPENLSHLEKANTHHLERYEWASYKQQVRNLAFNQRKPTYGDYGIYYAKGLPAIDGIPDPSASVRYTIDGVFMVMRGESIRKSEVGTKQYLAHAVLLVESDDFCGADYSAGDHFIWDIYNRYDELLEREKGGAGGPETWLQVGFNHHFTHVIEQISEFYVS